MAMNTVTICVLLITLFALHESAADLFDKPADFSKTWNIKSNQSGKFYCPKYHYVSNFMIKKTGDPPTAYGFYFECDLFTPPDFDEKGPERCMVRFKWHLPGYNLRMDDHFKSCSCDEYLAGIKTTAENGGRTMQFRCCFAKNKIHNITGCYFTGQRDLLAPHDTVVRIKKGKEVTEGIQTFAIIDNMVIGRVCPYLVKDKDIDEIDYMTNKCSGVKQRGIKDILDKIQAMAKECKIYTGSPFGWPQSQNSPSDDKNLADRGPREYQQQKTMCKDGSYLYAVYKFPKVGDKGKDYVFLTRCHVLVYTVCYCFWRHNCTKPEKRNTSESNKTMYVAGWRSQWDDQLARRKFEMWCCKTDGLKMHFCNLTKNFTDADTSLVIARPRYKFFAFYEPKCIDGQIIRDVDHWYINGILQLRFNICNINGSDGECEKPCKTCKDIDPTQAICRPPVVVVPPISRSTSTSTSGPTTTPGPTTSTSTPSTTTPPPKCRIDLNFILDSSGSLQPSGFLDEQNFMKAFVNKLTIGNDDSRIGLTMFATTAAQQWTFIDQPQTAAANNDRITNLDYWAQSTNIYAALKTTIPIFGNQAEQRKLSDAPPTCVSQVALLITDGRQNVEEGDPADAAAALKSMGVNLFAVGIGADANKDDLAAITGSYDNVFMKDEGKLTQGIDEIIKAVCAKQSGPCPTPATVKDSGANGGGGNGGNGGGGGGNGGGGGGNGGGGGGNGGGGGGNGGGGDNKDNKPKGG